MIGRWRPWAESLLLHALVLGVIAVIGGTAAKVTAPALVRLDFCLAQMEPTPAAAAAPQKTPAPLSPRGKGSVAAPPKTPFLPSSPSKAAVATPKRPPAPPPSPSKVPVAAPPPSPVAASLPVEAPPTMNAAPAVAAAPAAMAEAGKGRENVPPGAGGASVNPLDGTAIDTAEGGDRPDARVAEGYRQANYGAIHAAILANLRYPVLARRQGWQGKVEVAFAIDRHGRVDQLRILVSSGYNILDQQALAAVRKAAPFPAPPVLAQLVMPVSFELN